VRRSGLRIVAAADVRRMRSLVGARARTRGDVALLGQQRRGGIATHGRQVVRVRGGDARIARFAHPNHGS
jgi:hypothetical protein